MTARALATGVAFILASVGASSSAAASGDWHAEPHLGFARGDHHVDLRLELRYRYESWNAFVDDWDGFHGIRTRVGLDYRFRERFRLFAQGQQTAVLDLDRDSSGAGALYWNNNGQRSSPASVRLSQLFAEVEVTQGVRLRLGRSYVNQGTWVGRDDASYGYLKKKRISQRLLGSVDWTNGARAYDGGAVNARLGSHDLNLYVLQPTTGVFVVDEQSYEQNDDIWIAGADWTAGPGTLVKNTELGAFFFAYSDDRDPDDVAGLFGEIELYTLGGHMLGVYPLGPGRLDALAWVAIQTGDYVDLGPTSGVRDRNQLAGAVVAEVGYQLPDVWGKPWLRAGVNWGSGDGDPDDGDRHTFFNLLPTNHLYYGSLDQFALQNLVDVLAQLRLAPHPKVGVDLTYHRFFLSEKKDFRWAGTGAFSRKNLGYARNPSNGSDDAGHELDLTLSFRPHSAVSLDFGFSYLWGGDVFGHLADRNAAFGWAQVGFKY